MATLTKVFDKETEKVQHEHYILREELHTLELALQHLNTDFNDPTNLIAAKQIQMFAKQLADELPPHFQREERAILTTIADVSPELAFFATEMKRQHEDLRGRLAKFGCAIAALGEPGNMKAAVEDVRKEGQSFVRELKEHIALEEQELSGFL